MIEKWSWFWEEKLVSFLEKKMGDGASSVCFGNLGAISVEMIKDLYKFQVMIDQLLCIVVKIDCDVV